MISRNTGSVSFIFWLTAIGLSASVHAADPCQPVADAVGNLATMPTLFTRLLTIALITNSRPLK
jgi:hypothetical protein